MYVHPNVDEALLQIQWQLFAWQAIILSQIRIQSSRYQVGLDKPTTQTYRNLLSKMPEGKNILAGAYRAVISKWTQVRKLRGNFINLGNFSDNSLWLHLVIRIYNF